MNAFLRAGCGFEPSLLHFFVTHRLQLKKPQSADIGGTTGKSPKTSKGVSYGPHHHTSQWVVITYAYRAYLTVLAFQFKFFQKKSNGSAVSWGSAKFPVGYPKFRLEKNLGLQWCTHTTLFCREHTMLFFAGNTQHYMYAFLIDTLPRKL